MEFRRRSSNLRRPVLNELSSRSSSSDQSTDHFILIEEVNEFMNNNRNIINQSLNSSSVPVEEEIIKTRGRKKSKCSMFLRDLSPNSLVTFKSPIKNSKNEDLLRFLRSPTPRKCKLRDDDAPPASEIKRARKSLIVDLDVVNTKSQTTTTTSTPTTTQSGKKKMNKKTSSRKKKIFSNLRRSTNVKT